ncbi:hypothetical protein ABIF36_006363 [Bradyrhizobium japonicum]
MPRLLRFIIRKEAASSPILGGTEWRVSSPLGHFSILMTSAPMSASIKVQVGPAMTWVRSMTLRPASGPEWREVDCDRSLCIGPSYWPRHCGARLLRKASSPSRKSWLV